jgi:hypothetical protein
MADLSYDPTEFCSDEEYAKFRADMDREFGMPSKPYTGRVGRLVNEAHYRRDCDMNNDLGWGETTEAELRRRWDM